MRFVDQSSRSRLHAASRPVRRPIPRTRLHVSATAGVISCAMRPDWRWERAPERKPLSCVEQAAAKKRKVIVITFGGGARDQETFAPEGQENIPHLLHELAPAVELLHAGDRIRESSATMWRPPAWPPASTKLSITSPPFPPNIPPSSNTSARI